MVQNVGLLRFLKSMRKVEKSIPNKTAKNIAQLIPHIMGDNVRFDAHKLDVIALTQSVFER